MTLMPGEPALPLWYDRAPTMRCYLLIGACGGGGRLALASGPWRGNLRRLVLFFGSWPFTCLFQGVAADYNADVFPGKISQPLTVVLPVRSLAGADILNKELDMSFRAFDTNVDLVRDRRLQDEVADRALAAMGFAVPDVADLPGGGVHRLGELEVRTAPRSRAICGTPSILSSWTVTGRSCSRACPDMETRSHFRGPTLIAGRGAWRRGLLPS